MKCVILSDIHSGDSFGLANPANVSRKAYPFAKLLFDWYVRQIESIGPVDAVLSPGELTEGPGKKSTIELWTSDMEEQAECAAELIAMWGAREHYFCYASPYHAGDESKTDNMVVDKLKAYHNKPSDIKITQRLDIDGVKVNMAHVVGGGKMLESSSRAVMQTVSVDLVRSAYRDFQAADLYIRGHTHIYMEAKNNKWHSYNAPSLKWPLGQYGVRMDRALYTMGIGILDIQGPGSYTLDTKIFNYTLEEEGYHEVKRG